MDLGVAEILPGELGLVAQLLLDPGGGVHGREWADGRKEVNQNTNQEVNQEVLTSSADCIWPNARTCRGRRS